jgi:hypothetical protein
MKNALAMVSRMIFCLFLLTTATAVAQRGTLAGLAGVPVEGHEIVASFQYQGTKELDHRTFAEPVDIVHRRGWFGRGDRFEIETNAGTRGTKARFVIDATTGDILSEGYIPR